MSSEDQDGEPAREPGDDPGEARDAEGAAPAERLSATGLRVIAPPGGATARADAGSATQPVLGTVMLAVALGEVLTAVLALVAVLLLAAAGPPDGVAVALAVAGYPLSIAVWGWATDGVLRALAGWSPGRRTAIAGIAVGAAVASIVVLGVNYLMRDAPLGVSAVLASGLYVLVPAVVLRAIAGRTSRAALLVAALLLLAGAAAAGAVVADELAARDSAPVTG